MESTIVAGKVKVKIYLPNEEKRINEVILHIPEFVRLRTFDDLKEKILLAIKNHTGKLFSRYIDTNGIMFLNLEKEFNSIKCIKDEESFQNFREAIRAKNSEGTKYPTIKLILKFLHSLEDKDLPHKQKFSKYLKNMIDEMKEKALREFKAAEFENNFIKKDLDQKQIVHANVICSNCKKTVTGIRYMCAECDEFNLCCDCEKFRIVRKMHMEHTLIMAKKPMSDEEKNYYESVKDKIKVELIGDVQGDLAYISIDNASGLDIKDAVISQVRYDKGCFGCKNQFIDVEKNKKEGFKLILIGKDNKKKEGYFRLFLSNGYPVGKVISII